jgi:hypothetical protein
VHDDLLLAVMPLPPTTAVVTERLMVMTIGRVPSRPGHKP